MKLFLNIKSSARERHWDTYKEAQKLFNVEKVNIQEQSSFKTYSKNQVSIMSKIKSKILQNLDLINYQIVPKKDVNLYYVWGSIPKNIDNYIIEFDNPYVMTYYKVSAFHNKTDVLRDELKKSKKITFLSNAAKNHFLHYFPEFEEKSFINYPFMKRNYLNNKRDNKNINFIFVGLDFERKGGLEVLEAFSKVADENMVLNFVSYVKDEIKQKYENVNFIKPLKREKLFELYKQMDVFIMPTLHESFGVVFLEALSFGMGIIGTDVYATPEMIQNDFNGKLLHHPFIKPMVYNGLQVIDCTQKRIGEFNQNYRENGEFYYSLYQELKEAILEAKDNYKIWQKNSITLYEKKFSEEIWRDNFKRIIEK